MKVTLVLAFFATLLASGLAFEYDSSKGWYVPTLSGQLEWVSKEQYARESSIDSRATVQVKFYLYTKSNPTSPKLISVNDASALASSNFNKANPTRFIIHGWNNNYLSEVNVLVRTALLNSGAYNVICVDWSSVAESINYNTARNAVPTVGQMVANFIDFLNTSGGMSFSTLYVIGHSLGAHVSGFAGKLVKKGKINTIVGLDPAFIAASGLAFEYDSSKGWYVPTLSGQLEWVSKEQYARESSIDSRATVQVKFYLYTKSNPTSPKLISVNDASALASSNFNKANPTRFIIHGWNNNYLSEVNVLVRTALLNSGAYNVICVDWSSVAESINYNTARNAVPTVGQMVANFIDFLNTSGGMSFSTLYVIGHSLGAHVSGFAGKLVKKGKINTIVGLDPALPLFDYSVCSTRLCTTDASFVSSIQTNGGLLGFLQPIGKAAFYPNGGKAQPGCGVDLTGGCAHSRSYIYYSESIKSNNFPTMKCSTYDKAVAKDCGSTYSTVRMGASSNYGISGYFYVPVRSAAPFGMGS